jgi:hypothetical protein
MQWENNVKKFIHKPNIEIEIRLGKLKRHGFDPNIGKTAYDNILQMLNSYNLWTKSFSSSFTDIYYGTIRHNDSTNEVIYKNKLYASNKKLNKDFDIRLAISQEITGQLPDSRETFRRDKVRHSFFHTFYRIDITHITNCDSYELELEICDIAYAKKHVAAYLLDCLIKEIHNLLSCSCSNI